MTKYEVPADGSGRVGGGRSNGRSSGQGAGGKRSAGEIIRELIQDVADLQLTQKQHHEDLRSALRVQKGLRERVERLESQRDAVFMLLSDRVEQAHHQGQEELKQMWLELQAELDPERFIEAYNLDPALAEAAGEQPSGAVTQ